jgi:hypothetical protein
MSFQSRRRSADESKNSERSSLRNQRTRYGSRRTNGGTDDGETTRNINCLGLGFSYPIAAISIVGGRIPGGIRDALGPRFNPGGFGGALFQILRKFYGTDDIAFTFVSDEFNGMTLDNHGNVRPLIRRSFSSLSAAEEENGQSRIYLGIHWRFDKTEGIAQGRQVADYVIDNAFLPLRGKNHHPR